MAGKGVGPALKVKTIEWACELIDIEETGEATAESYGDAAIDAIQIACWRGSDPRAIENAVRLSVEAFRCACVARIARRMREQLAEMV